MRLILCMALVVLLATCFGVTLFAQATPTPEIVIGDVVYAGDGANARSGPGLNFPTIIPLFPGAKFSVLELDASGDWVKIDFAIPGQEAWVYRPLLTVIHPTPAPDEILMTKVAVTATVANFTPTPHSVKVAATPVPGMDKLSVLEQRIVALETSQAALLKRVAILESLVKVQSTAAQKPALLPPTSTPESNEPSHEILSIDAKITEFNNVFEKWAWVMVIQNKSDKTLYLSATIKFLDKDGFIVEQDIANNMVLDPQEKKEFNGVKLVNADISPNITNISAETQVFSSR